MIRLAMVMVAAALFLVPAAAQAGGWATVGLSSLPDGMDAGEPWVVDLQVLQHGRTPMNDVQPRVLLTGPGGARQAFPAHPTGEPGMYRARVVFPTAGRWRFAIDDGFTQTHTYAPVRIGGEPAAARAGGDSGSGANWLPALAVVFGAVLLFAYVGLLSRVSRRAPRAAR
jgi:hypothetical protein